MTSLNTKTKAKRKQLEARGWSDKRINQYLKDWRFHIPPTRSPHRIAAEDRHMENCDE